MKTKKIILTKAQKNHAIECLRQVIQIYGSCAELAREVNTTPQNINNWLSPKRNIPLHYIPRLVTLSNGMFKAPDFNPIVFKK